MEIQIAVLCDAATEFAGKINLLGAFDTINSPQMPASVPSCSIALRLMFEKIEEGAHKLRLGVVDEDGKLLINPVDFPLDIRVPEDAGFVARNLVINFQGLHFPKPGRYSVDLALDGRHERSIPLVVRQVSAPVPG